MTLCLTATEVREITGYARHARQCEALSAMGIRFVRQPQSGRPLVDRQDWRAYGDRPKRGEPPAPNWKAIRAA